MKHLSVHTAIRRGEVFFADLHGGVGYEQNGERPVVVEMMGRVDQAAAISLGLAQ